MILIYGHGDDPPLTLTLEALQEERSAYTFLDQRLLMRERLRLELDPGALHGRLDCAGTEVDLADVDSVFARPLEPVGTGARPEDSCDPGAWHAWIVQWLDETPGLVINRPRAMQGNASKPGQIQQIAALGFLVPETLVTSHPEEARAFLERHGRVIYKSISGIRSIVRELDAAAIERLNLLRSLPVQFQAYIPGTDIRAHVVGSDVFAAEIQTNGMDYRYAEREGGSTQMRATTLPLEVANRCVALAQAMDLPLAGIDLRLTPDGETVCFEVNPMPAYSYFEHQANLPISKAIARLLIDSSRHL
jgi:glutathione synthase/RimK-type ligase-like ATP-grasp enzyme